MYVLGSKSSLSVMEGSVSVYVIYQRNGNRLNADLIVGNVVDNHGRAYTSQEWEKPLSSMTPFIRFEGVE